MVIRSHRLASATQRVTLVPLGDLQWSGDDEAIAYDRLERHIARCLTYPTPLFIGMGDYIDFASPSNRRRIDEAGLYDTAKQVIADATKALVDDLFARLLKGTRGKWLGMVQGHHHHPCKVAELKDGTAVHEDSDVYLAKKLNAPWLDEMGVIKLMFPGGGVVRVLALHGSGYSVYPWGPLNRLHRLQGFRVDVMLMGHQTKMAKSTADALEFPPDRDDVEDVPVKMVGTGGWMKGYVNGRRTYVSQAGLSPVTLGQPVIHIRPERYAGRWYAGITEES